MAVHLTPDGRCSRPRRTQQKLCFYYPEHRDLSTNKSAREKEWSTKVKTVLLDIRTHFDASDNAVAEDTSVLAHNERARTSLVQQHIPQSRVDSTASESDAASLITPKVEKNGNINNSNTVPRSNNLKHPLLQVHIRH